ncbi:MAG TPA: hypothetical protein VGL91_08010 [Acidobacteriota bacterium]
MNLFDPAPPKFKEGVMEKGAKSQGDPDLGVPTDRTGSTRQPFYSASRMLDAAPFVSVEPYKGWTIKFNGRELIGTWDDSWTAERKTERSFYAHAHTGERRFNSREEAILSATKVACNWIDTEEQKNEVNPGRSAPSEGNF